MDAFDYMLFRTRNLQPPAGVGNQPAAAGPHRYNLRRRGRDANRSGSSSPVGVFDDMFYSRDVAESESDDAQMETTSRLRQCRVQLERLSVAEINRRTGRDQPSPIEPVAGPSGIRTSSNRKRKACDVLFPGKKPRLTSPSLDQGVKMSENRKRKRSDDLLENKRARLADVPTPPPVVPSDDAQQISDSPPSSPSDSLVSSHTTSSGRSTPVPPPRGRAASPGGTIFGSLIHNRRTKTRYDLRTTVRVNYNVDDYFDSLGI